MNPVVVERRGHAAWLTFNRPDAANALSKALVVAAREALRELRARPDVRALVVTGAGDKAFCAGADLKERLAMSLEETRAFLHELHALGEELTAVPAPTLAAINGAALGGGLELALCCDLRIAVDTAVMGLPEVRLGIIPGAGGTQRLPRVVGLAAAKELILTGRRVDAQRALALGLVSAIALPGELAVEAERWVTDLSAAGPLAAAQAKRAIDEGWGLTLGDALEVERRAYEVVLASDDRNEGLRAFAEKRAPVFSGK